MNSDDLASQIAADLMETHTSGEYRLETEDALRERALATALRTCYFQAGITRLATVKDIAETAAECFLDVIPLDDLTPAQKERIARDDAARGEPAMAIR